MKSFYEYIESKNWNMQEMPIKAMHFLPNKNWPELAKHTELPSDKLSPTPERQGIVPATIRKAPMHGFHKDDIGILTSPAGQSKIIQKWNTTGHEFDIYFVRTKDAKKYLETGNVSTKWVKEKLNIEIEPKENIITIIFTNNIGAERMPLNYWTIAHRLGHAARKDYAWNEYRETLEREFSNILEDVYGHTTKFYSSRPYYSGDKGYDYNAKHVSFEHEKQMLWIALALGTMKSARDKALNRFGEFQQLVKIL